MIHSAAAAPAAREAGCRTTKPDQTGSEAERAENFGEISWKFQIAPPTKKSSTFLEGEKSFANFADREGEGDFSPLIFHRVIK